MSGRKKLANRMARHVMDGTVSVNQARAVLGKKPLASRGTTTKAYGPPPPVAAAVKSAGSRGISGAVSPVGTGLAAAPRTSVPALTSFGRDTYLESNDPSVRENARNYGAGPSGHRPWVAPLPGLVREAAANPGAWQRERARMAVQKSKRTPEQAAASSVRILAWGAAADGAAGWQPPSQPVPPGLQIAVPGTAGR